LLFTDGIDSLRQDLIAETTAIVYDVVDQLSNGSANCPSLHCDSLFLGELVKTFSKHGLLWPRATKPFANLGVAELFKSLSTLSRYQQREVKASSGTGATAVNGTGRHANGAKGTKYVSGANGINDANGPDRPISKKQPVNGSVEGRFTLPEEQTNGDYGGHDCDATRLLKKFHRLKKLVDGVDGLELGL
jgi:hypothetical protein